MTDSTLKVLALLACLALLPARAINHEDVVAPIAPGKFAVACSNVEHDLARLAQLGGTASDYWEGNDVNGNTRYITDILAHPESAFTFPVRVPFNLALYPTRWLQNMPFAAIVCYPTPRSNNDPSYALPDDGGTVPHMQPAGAAPKIISTAEYYQTLGLSLDLSPTGTMTLPLIVYSHGLGGSPLGKGYLDVMVALAAQGYMIAGIFHADARISRIRIEDVSDLAYLIAFFPQVSEMEAMRPLALRVMTDELLSRPAYRAGIDTDRIGGFGASLGGEAMALLTGANLTASITRSCEKPEHDPRIRATVGYVPFAGWSFMPAFCDGQEGAKGVNRPFLGISGTADTTAPIAQAQQAVNNMQSSHYLVELINGQHELRPEDAGDVLTWTVTFLNAYLDVRADPGAMGRFIRMRQVVGGREDNIIVDVHVPFANTGGDTNVKEFWNSVTNHYFMAAGQGEIDGIVAGVAGAGWQLTGQSFKAWLDMPSDTTFGAAPVCRFYGTPAGGPNSHFFTASADECSIVKRAGSGWFYEGIGFYILPVGNPRVCPAGYLSVNRAYNNRAAQNDSNHRFTTSDSTLREMGSKGWAMEGTVMCARP